MALTRVLPGPWGAKADHAGPLVRPTTWSWAKPPPHVTYWWGTCLALRDTPTACMRGSMAASPSSEEGARPPRLVPMSDYHISLMESCCFVLFIYFFIIIIINYFFFLKSLGCLDGVGGMESRNFPDAHNELACWDVSDCSATWSRTEHAQAPPSLRAPPDRACVPGSRSSPR